MSICYIDFYLKEHPTNRVLILTHGTTILRKQYYEEILKYHPDFENNCEMILNGKDILTSNKKVIVTLPQTISQIKEKPHFDLLVVDEGHQFYFAENKEKGIDGMVKSIKKSCGVKQSLILTGTPSPFILRGYNIIPITIEMLLQYKMISDLRIEIATSCYNFTFKDYTEDRDLKLEIPFSEKDTIITLDDLLEKIVKKLLDVFKNNPKIYSSLKSNFGWSLPLLTMKKSMIACHSIEQAIQVENYFKNKGINVVLSHSIIGKQGYDKDSNKIQEFQNDNKILVLIVVGRGILGFNMKELVNVIDMTCSHNLDRIFQLMCRVIRKHPDGDKKLFFKIVPEHLEYWFLNIMKAVMCLTNEYYYIRYNGKNLLGLEIPILEPIKKTKRDKIINKDKIHHPPKPKLDLKMWDVPNSIKFFNKLINDKDTVLNMVYWTTLKSVWKNFNGYTDWESMSNDEFMIQLQTRANENNWKSLNEIRENSPTEYSVLMDRKISKDFSDMMGWEYRIRWNKMTDEDFLIEVVNEVKKNDWNKISDLGLDLQAQIQRRKLGQKICELKGWKYKNEFIWVSKISKEELFNKLEIISIENNCKRINDLYKLRKSLGGVNILRENNQIGEFCEYMKWEYSPKGKWSSITDDKVYLEKMVKEANKHNCKQLSDVFITNPTGYEGLRSRKLIKPFVKLINWKPVVYHQFDNISKEELFEKLKILAEEKEYTKVSDFKSTPLYVELCKRHLNSEFCKYMNWKYKF